jgi:hypothetical protein
VFRTVLEIAALQGNRIIIIIIIDTGWPDMKLIYICFRVCLINIHSLIFHVASPEA